MYGKILPALCCPGQCLGLSVDRSRETRALERREQGGSGADEIVEIGQSCVGCPEEAGFYSGCRRQ